MADEYIRRVEAEEAIEEYCCRMCKDYNEIEGGCVSHAQHCPHLSGEEILKPVKSADVQPVRRGWWEENHDYIECSCCKFSVIDTYCEKRDYTSTETFYSFCPNCGAKMDGETT